jgi:transcriptional regulator GlxA family with amidase domain
MHTAIIAFDGFTDLDVFAPFDLLTRVATLLPDRAGGMSVKVLAATPTVRSAGGLVVHAHGALEEAAAADAVIVGSGPQSRSLCEDPIWLDRLRGGLDPSRQHIASMCSGALILAGLGLLDGRRATTYPTAMERLARFGVEVVDEPLVVQGTVATAAGCLAAFDLCDWLLRQRMGDAVADTVRRSIAPNGRLVAA